MSVCRLSTDKYVHVYVRYVCLCMCMYVCTYIKCVSYIRLHVFDSIYAKLNPLYSCVCMSMYVYVCEFETY